MICPNCKNEVSQGAAFCANCGANLTQVAQAAQPEVVQPEAAQPEVAQPQVAQAPVAQPAQPVAAQPEIAQPQQAIPQNNDFAQPAQPTQPAQPYAQNNANPSYQQPINPTVIAAENPLATQALVFGIISAALGEIGWFTYVVAAIFGAGALVMGILGLKKSNAALALANQGYNKRPMCIIGKVLSIVGIVSGSIAILIGIISMCVCGCSSCTSNYWYY